MARMIIQCEYPFWLPGGFLFHTQSRERRMEIFKAWIENIYANKYEHPEHLVLRNLPKEPVKCKYDVAKGFLRLFDWNLVGFDHEIGESGQPSGTSLKVLPSNLMNQKGGVLAGTMTKAGIEDFKKESTTEEENERLREEKASSIATSFLSALEENFLHEIAAHESLANSLTCSEVMLDLVFFDWNLGLFSVSYAVEVANLDSVVMEELGALGAALQEYFVKHVKDKATFDARIMLPAFEDLRHEITKDAGKVDLEQEPLEKRYQGRNGWTNPYFVFIEYLVRAFGNAMPVDLRDSPSGIRSKGYIEDFFQIQLKLIDKKSGSIFKRRQLKNLVDFDENVRLPFTSNHFIFFPERPSEAITLVKANLTPLIEDAPYPATFNPLEKDASYTVNLIEPTPTVFSGDGIIRAESGFNGNCLVVSPKLCGWHEPKSFKELLQISDVAKVIWLWRIGGLYFSALHRMQGLLVTRKGIHVEAQGMIQTNNYEFLSESVEKEIQRLELMQITIEMAMQESSVMFLCDNVQNRTIYQAMRTAYRSDELEALLRRQIPVMKEDLDSDNKKYFSRSMHSLSYLVFVTTLITLVKTYHEIRSTDTYKNLISDGFGALICKFQSGDFWYHALIMILLILLVPFVFYFGRSLITKEPYLRTLRKIPRQVWDLIILRGPKLDVREETRMEAKRKKEKERKFADRKAAFLRFIEKSKSWLPWRKTTTQNQNP